MDGFSLPGALRRIRRTGDWSQRQLADQIESSKTAVAAAENGTRDLPVSVLALAASAIGGRLTVLDAAGDELAPMEPGAVRDAAGRRFPAHLDTRHGDEHWWGGEHRPLLRQPRYTFDLDRSRRDGRRSDRGTAADHHRPHVGDSLSERAAVRRAEAEQRRRDRIRRLRVAGLLSEPVEWTCACPPACAELDKGERPQHSADCPCGCDVD